MQLSWEEIQLTQNLEAEIWHAGSTYKIIRIFNWKYYLEGSIQSLRLNPVYLHVIITFTDFKIIFSYFGSHGASSLISSEAPLASRAGQR